VNWNGEQLMLMVGPSWKYAPVSTIVTTEQRITKRLTVKELCVVAYSLRQIGDPVEIALWEQEVFTPHAKILTEIRTLHRLRLSHCSISADALELLGKSSLRSLYIRSCDTLSDKDIDNFRQKYQEIKLLVD